MPLDIFIPILESCDTEDYDERKDDEPR